METKQSGERSKKTYYSSLKLKLIIIFTIVIAIPFSVMSIYVLPQQIRSQYIESSSQQLKLADENMQTFLSNIQNNVNYLAPANLVKSSSGHLTSYVDRGEEDDRVVRSSGAGGIEQQIFETYDSFRLAHPYIEWVYLGLESKEFIQTPGETTLAAHYDPTTRPFYTEAVAGKGEFVLEPYEYDGSVLLEVAKAVYDGDQLLGVAGMDVNLDSMTEMLNQIKIGRSGYLILLHQDGTVISDAADSKFNLKDIKALKITGLDSISQAGDGAKSTTFQGERYLTNVYTSPSTGWKVIAMIPQKEISSATFNVSILILLLAALTYMIGLVMVVRFTDAIQIPIRKLSRRLELLADGDLHSEVPTVKSKDDVGILASALHSVVGHLNSYIGEIGSALGNMVNGQLNISLKQNYLGDFISIRESIQTISNSLSQILTEINQSASQVNLGSRQISDVSQDLAQGSLEQASSVENLSATISEISVAAEQNAEHASNVYSSLSHVQSEIEVSNQQMRKMVSAMSLINQSSENIGKIIKTIEEIAFQTNILALNAAVEAQRAGSAGKGFAVVADEVRNLAGRSTAAAKDTTDLIEESVIQVDNGTKILDETAKSLQNVVESMRQVTGVADKIVLASSEQAKSIEKVTSGVAQISKVIQSNSATAEESAAASEELTGQAQILKELVQKFKLN